MEERKKEKMKKNGKKILCAGLLAVIMAFSMAVPAFAAETEAVDMAEYTEAIAIDYNKPQVQAMAGLFTQTYEDGRTIKIYMPESVGLRARFISIAVPSGVNTVEFLTEKGWFEQADKHCEALFIFEPGENGWGSVEEEQAYLKEAAATMTSGKNLAGIQMFSNHGTFGMVGYEDGAAILESWTAQNPIWCLGQVLVDGQSAGADFLAEVGAQVYGSHARVDEAWFYEAIENMGLTADDVSTKGTTPVPTMFVGYAEDDASIAYWKANNDVLPEADENGVFHQDINSLEWQTLYANANKKSWNPDTAYGIAQVKLVDEADAAEIYDFLSGYTRYTATWAYPNNLAVRMHYEDTALAARQQTGTGEIAASYAYTAFDGTEAAADLRALQSQRVSYPDCAVEGTLYIGALATLDYDGDGVQDPREFVIYVPDSAEAYGETGAPMLLASPGKVQTAETFLECSGLVPLANDEGCVVLFVGEPYDTTNAVAVSYACALRAYLGDDDESSNYARGLMALMKEFDGANIDFTRVYTTGHSAGSNVSEELALVSDSDWIAAVGSTSFITRNENLSEGIMPVYFLCGMTDINDQRVDYGANDPYVSTPENEGATTLNSWFKRVMAKNGLAVTFTDDDRQSFIDSCSWTNLEGTRYLTYGWNNDQGITLVQFGRTMLREHNCYPEEFRLIWDFVSHFRVEAQEDGTLVRTYSPSAFEDPADAIVIE